MSHDRKHKPRYLGPYEVLERTDGGNYKLCELDGALLQYTYAAFRLLLYITRRHPFMLGNLDTDPDSDSAGTDTNEADSDLSD